MAKELWLPILDGDWHKQLREALIVAENSTSSPHILKHVAQLKAAMAREDECIHTITIRQPIPLGCDTDYIVQKLKFSNCEDARIDTDEPGFISINFTRRGNRKYVEERAMKDVAIAMRAAKQLWARILTMPAKHRA